MLQRAAYFGNMPLARARLEPQHTAPEPGQLAWNSLHASCKPLKKTLPDASMQHIITHCTLLLFQMSMSEGHGEPRLQSAVVLTLLRSDSVASGL